MCQCDCGEPGPTPEPPFTVEQVEDALSKGKTTKKYFSGDTYVTKYGREDGEVEWNDVHYESEGTSIETPLGPIKVIETEGGGEGDGEHAHLVVKVETGGQFFRKDGWYQSYDGLYLDGEFREVQEVTKTVKVYE